MHTPPDPNDLVPHHWHHAEFGCQSSDWPVLQRQLLAAAAARGFSVQVLGHTAGEPIYFLQRDAAEPGASRRLIASGFHGEEPAGPWGLLRALNTLDDETLGRAHLALLPLVNVTGFKRGTRLNHLQQNPNRGFLPRADGVPASEEGQVLQAHEALLLERGRDGVLSCHEDEEARHAYLYANEHGAAPGAMAQALLQPNAAIFGVQPDGTVDGNPVRGGFVFNQFDSSFECWLFKRGVACSYCTETPGQREFDRRVAANAAMISAFIVQP